MANSYTTTYSLTKPEVGAAEDQWGGLLNTNFDAIDDILDGTTPVTGIDINSGTIDGVTIGATVAPTVTNLGSVATADINGGTIDGTVIGGTTPAAITGTTLTATSSATLQHSASTKLATTSTGIDVTGTVTADGLTVDGDILVSDGTPSITLSDADGTNQTFTLTHNSATSTFDVRNNTSHGNMLFRSYDGTSYQNKLRLDSTGDISFYEDTGTTAKLFWDASAEALGIGTSSPSGLLTLNNSSASAQLYIRSGDTNDSAIIFGRQNDIATGSIAYFHSDDSLRFSGYNNAERLRIDSSGNVGIGTSSPTATLHVNTGSGTGNLDGVLIESTDGGSASSPDLTLYRNSATPADNDGVGALWFYGNNSGLTETLYAGILGYSTDVTAGTEDGELAFVVYSAGSLVREAMRIDSSGNLLVGQSSTADPGGANIVGVGVGPSGFISSSRISGGAAYFNRKTTDGDIVYFRKDGTTVGSIGNSHSSGHIGIFSPSSGIGCYSSGIYPINGAGSASDNSKDLGSLSVRWDDVYATNGTIQTSDANEKQDIAELDEAEKRVAVAAKGLIRKYRWKDAVAEKGDDARIHVGIIAQDLQAAFAAEGLDAGRYAMFISSTWWEADEVIPAVEAVEAVDAVYEDVVIPAVLDEEGNEVEPERTEQRLVSEAIEAVEAQPERTVTHHYETAEEAPEGATERTRLGVRYPELLAFIIGAL